MKWNGARRFLPVSTLLAALVVVGCGQQQPEGKTTFYDRNIGPILTGSCSTSPTKSSCHVRADSHGNALGNLDTSSYNTLALRRDLFIDHGPYGLPGLLLKVVKPYQVSLSSYDGGTQNITTHIAHSGRALLDLTSSSFTTLSRWIQRGAQANNSKLVISNLAFEPCTTKIGSDKMFDPNKDPSTKDYGVFVSTVNSVLGKRCANGNCHGSPTNTLYLTCGTSPEQQRWNYFAASDYVSKDVNASEILRRALAPDQGGAYHEGGTVFTSPKDPDYKALVNWAKQRGGPLNVPTDPAFDFFAKRVQPMLVKRGCMQIGCHSAGMGHEYRLQGGTGGHFGLSTTRRNFELTLEQIALDSPDPNASRIIQKNLPPSEGGLVHRGGPLFASAGDPSKCDLNAAATGDLDQQPEYCVLVAWIEMERAARMASAQQLSGIVYVKRPPASGPDTPQDYSTYQPGADLMRAPATLDAQGAVQVSGAGSSLLSMCGLDPTTADVRRPAVSWDGKKIAFAARSSAKEGLKIYVIDGTTCAPDPTINAAPTDENGKALPTNGEIIHNFDPAYAPDGRLVFASTRGNIMNTGVFDYQGPQRSPADPSKPNADLYVLENGKIRQLTFLLDQELAPSFMNDGRLIFTTEKRAPGFYQLAERRENLDGGDYHPLFGQRDTIGYNQLFNVVELSNKDFVGIVSDKGAQHSAGALALVNRSVGIDQHSTNPKDFLQDQSAVDYPNPSFYQHSMSIVDPAATGKLDKTKGAYRDPSPLPDAQILVSYAANVTDLKNFKGNFDIVSVNPHTGVRTPLISDADDLIWPVAVYAHYNPHGVYRSKLDEPNGATHVYTTPDRKDRSQITVLDMPLLASLLFQNTRSGRLMPPANTHVQVWEDLPPTKGITSVDQSGSFLASDQYGKMYVRRRLLGSLDILKDGSTRFEIPGGMPIVLSLDIQLAGDSAPVKHFQREEMQFYPGEVVRQGFPHKLFNGLCGNCHGAVSGLESHVALDPDILTQASNVAARTAAPVDLVSKANGSPKGPPFP